MTRGSVEGPGVTDPALADQIDLLRQLIRTTSERWRARADAGHIDSHPLPQVLQMIEMLECAYGVLGGGADVSPPTREGIQDQLQRTEERFRLLVDGVRDYAIFMLDPEGRITSWNRGAQRLKGYSAEEILGSSFSVFYTSEDVERGRPKENLYRAAVAGSVRDVGWRRRKDGTEFWAEVLITALRDEEGALRGFAKVTRDNTEQRRAEEARRFLYDATAVLASSLDLQQTLDRMARIVVPMMADWCLVDLVDDDGMIRQMAAAHIDPDKAVLARELARRFPPQPDLAHGVAHVIRTGQAEIYPDMTDTRWLGELLGAEHPAILRQLGTRSYICAPLVARGRVLGALTYVRSVKGKRYEAAHLRDAEELGRRAGLLIDNARLYDDAQAAIRARDEFLTIASHELRTPVTTLQLGIDSFERLLHDTGEERLSARVGSLQRQIGRLGRLVEGLLDVSRVTTGRIELEREEFDLAEAVSSAVDDCRLDAERSRSEIRLRLAPVVGSWDRARIEQITTHLLSNAVKYGGGEPIDVVLERRDDRAIVSVRDYGIGISQERLAEIFERFARASSVREFGGLGLGLYITRQVVEAHGGRVMVESRPGTGATFTVELPLRSSDEARHADSGE